MMETLEEIEDEDEMEEIDEFIYDNYEEFRPFIYIYEELVGPKNHAVWDESYTRGQASGRSKTYTVVKDGLLYRLNVQLIEDDRIDANLHCRITVDKKWP